MYTAGVDIPVTNLESLMPDDPWLSHPVDVHMAWDVHFTETNNPHTHDEHTPQINHITNQIPPVPLLGQQSEDRMIPEVNSTIHCSLETRVHLKLHNVDGGVES